MVGHGWARWADLAEEKGSQISVLGVSVPDSGGVIVAPAMNVMS